MAFAQQAPDDGTHMKVAEVNEAEPPATGTETIIQIPLGLLGFENLKQYALLANPQEAPFLWLQGLDDPSLAFLVVSPAEVVPEYEPDISAEDVEFLGLEHAEDALIYNIVTLRGPGRATINLKGPIVINCHTLLGKQVVPINVAEYSVQHPLVGSF
jgi:flagellar assembly factor FliW